MTRVDFKKELEESPILEEGRELDPDMPEDSSQESNESEEEKDAV